MGYGARMSIGGNENGEMAIAAKLKLGGRNGNSV
jgi:hypothetical protein